MAHETAVAGRFRIVARIGAGGMGEVYRAHDERLRRDVALKVLPAGVADDPERLRRFEREARAAAALNHPNILALYDLGEHGGAPYLVTELLEGESLRERLVRGPMAVREAVGVGVQVVRGLAAAHGKGIVHRDVKPDNLFVTTDGTVKILDFGLASLRGEHEAGERLTHAETASGMTRAGTVLGTAGYMAPEQVRGLQVDQRADIFAFGCVLYEMLTGQRAFRGATAADTLGAILKEEPVGVEAVGSGVTPALAQLVRRCLEKRPEDRFTSAHDLGLALQAAVSDVDTGLASAAAAGQRRPRRLGLTVGVGAVLALAVAAGAWLRWGRGGGGAVAALDPAKVMVAPFENRTGDPALDSAGRLVSEAVAQGLVEMGDVEVAAAPEAASSGGRLPDEAAWRAAAAAAGAGTLVTGSCYLVGDSLELRGRVGDVATGKVLYALRSEAGARGTPAQAIDRVKQRVMGAVLLRLGVAPALGGITVPPLYSAYQEFIAAASAMGVDPEAVTTHLERAAVIDPEFWHPQLRLMAWYKMTGDVAKFEALHRHILDNQDSLGPADRIMLQYYEAQFDGRTLEAYRKAREVLAVAPRDFTFVFAAAKLAVDLNRPREALDCIADLEKLDWKYFSRWMQGTWLLQVAGFAHHLLGEYEAELRVVGFGERLYPDMLNLREGRVSALAALGRVADVDQAVAESLAIRSRQGTAGTVMLRAAEELRAHCETEAAHRLASQCADWFAGRSGDEARRAAVPFHRFECLWLAERWREGEDLAEALAARLPDSLRARGYRAISAARGGDRAVGGAVDRDLAAADDIGVQGAYSWMRACIAAQLGDRERAVELLRTALSHGFTDLRSLHVYIYLEPLHGFPPYEGLIAPKG